MPAAPGISKSIAKSICKLLCCALVAAVGAATPGGAAELVTGDYSFSDELGGFRLLSASGSGTTEDPVVLVEELASVEPITLVIRRRAMPRDDRHPTHSQLTLVKEVVNRSERIWAGFELELQETYKEPSTYSDGLSFKQFASRPGDVASDRFTLNDRRFEPYDRISFQGGSVDPGATVRIRVTITDPTPVRVFYLLQDPNLLSAGLPARGRSFAARRQEPPARLD
jgi:hypothetical protein